MDEHDEASVKWAKALAWVSVGAGGVILITFIVFLAIGRVRPSSHFDPELTGIVGDFIGGIVGSLWALAGVFFFFWALLYQRRDLNLQSEQLNLQKEEMSAMAKALEQSNSNQDANLRFNREQYLDELYVKNLSEIIVGIFGDFEFLNERSKGIFRTSVQVLEIQNSIVDEVQNYTFFFVNRQDIDHVVFLHEATIHVIEKIKAAEISDVVQRNLKYKIVLGYWSYLSDSSQKVKTLLAFHKKYKKENETKIQGYKEGLELKERLGSSFNRMNKKIGQLFVEFNMQFDIVAEKEN